MKLQLRNASIYASRAEFLQFPEALKKETLLLAMLGIPFRS